MMKLPSPFPPPDLENADPDAPVFLDDPSFRLSCGDMQRLRMSAAISDSELKFLAELVATRYPDLYERLSQTTAAAAERRESGTSSGDSGETEAKT